MDQDQQPYYFQIIPMTLISKSLSSQQGNQFKFSIEKDHKIFETSKNSLKANFKHERMEINNVELNFFLPCYIQKSQTKFLLKITRISPNKSQSVAGQHLIDTKTYIQLQKNTSINIYPQVCSISSQFSLQYKLVFHQSRYHLQKLLKSQQINDQIRYKKPLVPKYFKIQTRFVQEDQLDDNKYQHKLHIIRRFSKAGVRTGGYKFQSEQDTPKIKQRSNLKRNKSFKDNNTTNQIHNLNQVKVFNPEDNIGKIISQENKTKKFKLSVLMLFIMILAASGYFIYTSLQSNQIQSSLSKQKTKISPKQKKNKNKKEKKDSFNFNK